MICTRIPMGGYEEFHPDTVFEISFTDEEIGGGYCQLQLNLTRRRGYASVEIDWGDGTVDTVTATNPWHNFTGNGPYRVSIGGETKWWRLIAAYTVTSENRRLVSRPKIRPIHWSDTLESCKGTFCGWSNPKHGGVVGEIIPWGRSITSTFCCYQGCTDVTGPFPSWTDAIVEADATFDGCTGLSGRLPKWGKNIETANQCYQGCTGARGAFPKWPRGCRTFSMCFRNAVNLVGEIPEWPESASELDGVFEGCTGATGLIPAWPESVTNVNRCYYGCRGLTGAWTDDPALLMPEDKLKPSPSATFWYCENTVTGCSDAVRNLFWEKPWGGLLPRPTT